jgi:hypothetical protein
MPDGIEEIESLFVTLIVAQTAPHAKPNWSVIGLHWMMEATAQCCNAHACTSEKHIAVEWIDSRDNHCIQLWRNVIGGLDEE